MYIDHSVYPDLKEPPTNLTSPEEMADYVHRICAAWDFCIHPEPETFALFYTWKDIFDRFPIVTSPAYHAFRTWFGWETTATPLHMLAPTPQWVVLDRLAERDVDPCDKMI